VATLKIPVHLIGFLAIAENMPDGRAQRPGDVVRSCSGRTIEVLNTDAEGRLVLADALTYAQRYHPDLTIDLATLTGEAGRTFANVISPILGNDWSLISGLVEAGLAVHERVWPLPIAPEYRDSLNGDVSDIKNTALVAGLTAGSIVGASFLAEFAGDGPWAHLDLANTSWSPVDLGYFRKGATGVGVRLLTGYIETLVAESKRPAPRRGRGKK
jgi:leucyl aminopeptidase